jgi:hypothetical protein
MVPLVACSTLMGFIVKVVSARVAIATAELGNLIRGKDEQRV